MSNEANGNIFLQIAGRKHREKMGAQLNEGASVGVNSFAKRQLEKLGWKDGDGLGKNRHGMATHIKVVKRSDEQGGLGKSSVDEKLGIGNEWWKHSVGNTLAKLASKSKKKKKEQNDKKSRKTHFTDEELFAATGGARFGTKGKGKQQTGKWKRAESDISREEEETAVKTIEWDGMSAPVVLLSDKSSSNQSKERQLDIESDPQNPKKKNKSKSRHNVAKEERTEEQLEKRKESKKRKNQKDSESQSKKKRKSTK